MSDSIRGFKKVTRHKRSRIANLKKEILMEERGVRVREMVRQEERNKI
jgi:hypothetical protein